MKVHINFSLNGDEVAWTAEAGRKLVLINKTGESGNCVEGVNMGFMKNGRLTYIFINPPKVRPSSKTVGIFCWPDSFTTDKGIRFLGKTKNKYGEVEGMYGIFDLGTVIHTREGSEWELSEEGWIQRVEG